MRQARERRGRQSRRSTRWTRRSSGASGRRGRPRSASLYSATGARHLPTRRWSSRRATTRRRIWRRYAAHQHLHDGRRAASLLSPSASASLAAPRARHRSGSGCGRHAPVHDLRPLCVRLLLERRARRRSRRTTRSRRGSRFTRVCVGRTGEDAPPCSSPARAPVRCRSESGAVRRFATRDRRRPGGVELGGRHTCARLLLRADRGAQDGRARDVSGSRTCLTTLLRVDARRRPATTTGARSCACAALRLERIVGRALRAERRAEQGHRSGRRMKPKGGGDSQHDAGFFGSVKFASPSFAARVVRRRRRCSGAVDAARDAWGTRCRGAPTTPRCCSGRRRRGASSGSGCTASSNDEKPNCLDDRCVVASRASRTRSPKAA